ncbi:hypothetical protein ABFX02_12G060500 [Erythranthe guttata]
MHKLKFLWKRRTHILLVDSKILYLHNDASSYLLSTPTTLLPRRTTTPSPTYSSSTRPPAPPQMELSLPSLPTFAFTSMAPYSSLSTSRPYFLSLHRRPTSPIRCHQQSCVPFLFVYV